MKLDLLTYAVKQYFYEQAACLSEEYKDRFRFATTGAYFDPKWVSHCAGINIRWGNWLSRRSHPRLDSRFVIPFWGEQWKQWSCRMARSHYSYFAAHDRVAQKLANRMPAPKMLIAADTGAESLFRIWNDQTYRVLDLTIGLPQSRSRIYDKARSLNNQQDIHFDYPGEWELQRYQYEVENADHILCGSEFVKSTCLEHGLSADKLTVIPYGFDNTQFQPSPTWNAQCSPIKIVFVGTLCHRKGSHLLLEAYQNVRQIFPNTELHIYGNIINAPESVPENTIFHGRVPIETLAKDLPQMHLMVFPTYFEGSSLSIYLALASGVPVITTPNCGSIVDSSCGWIMTEITGTHLTDIMNEALTNLDRLETMHIKASEKASHYTWNAYGKRIKEFTRKHLSN